MNASFLSEAGLALTFWLLFVSRQKVKEDMDISFLTKIGMFY